MNKVLLSLNIVLIILVGVLYYLFFTKDKPANKAKVQAVEAISGEPEAGGPVRIAYLDLDSIQNHFDYYKKLKADIEARQRAANNELDGMQRKYQTRTQQLQQQANTMTQQQQENAMLEINQMQQNFQKRQSELDKSLFDANQKMQDDILGKLESFLKDYNKNGTYTYILSYEPGFMFYKDSTLNITPEVISGLNETYSAEKK